MSETHVRQSRRDRGMTLPELLIAVTVLGAIMAVLSSALIVTFRQQSGTEGRLNVARAEQNISMWIPADLASAALVTTDPAALPCSTNCPPGLDLGSGSNALLLTWTIEGVTTNVGYVFVPNVAGLYDLWRVECIGGSTCTAQRLLSDLPGPPGGELFQPGVTRPDWVIQVSEPLAADATSEDELAPADSKYKDARRVVVTINGGGSTADGGGGINQISITAGGTRRSEIDANSLQGAPSFVEARSRCGGAMVLVVDESNSIGGNISNVRNGVRTFVEALAGTPVKLQVVRFHTRASVLGTGDWTRYYDLTEQADVDALLGVIPNLQGSWPGVPARDGGTNWEDALFRTFYTPDGQIQQSLPDTVVFFTDGMPTYGRLNDVQHSAAVTRGAPGVLTGTPAPPPPPWPNANGTAYNQVSFNRASFIATQFRSSVRLIGVGVGAGITDSSSWMSNPGAGYHVAWERGSHSHQRATNWEPQSRWQVRNNGGANSYYNSTKADYDSRADNRRRIQWGPVGEALFVANNTSPGESDGYRRHNIGSWVPTTAASYDAAQGTLDAELYRTVSKTWSNGPDWEPWTGDRPGSSSHYRSTKVYSPPFEEFDPPITANTNNSVILARLIAGNDTGVPAQWDGSRYTNPEVADMYIAPAWSQFTTALEAVALGECGGTLTLQTRIGGTAPASDPFTYQNSAVRDSAGEQLVIEPTIVRTNQQFTTGTFDFAIPNGQFVDVDIVPQNLSDLVGYSPNAWSCRAGVNDRPLTALPIDGSPWSGIRVRVAANEAVACTLSVTKL